MPSPNKTLFTTMDQGPEMTCRPGFTNFNLKNRANIFTVKPVTKDLSGQNSAAATLIKTLFVLSAACYHVSVIFLPDTMTTMCLFRCFVGTQGFMKKLARTNWDHWAPLWTQENEINPPLFSNFFYLILSQVAPLPFTQSLFLLL